MDIADPGFQIGPCEEILFVGSCFADSIGRRFQEEKFRATVNPYGVMYNPASVLHSIERWVADSLANETSGPGQSSAATATSFPTTAFLTLGTNRVYRLKESGEIVDNCQKRPQALFSEEDLSVEACADYLSQAISQLRQVNPDIRIVLTVSPIRYRKYGYHGSQLSKATLLLAVEKICANLCQSIAYFPAYEIVNDELRDYRFYAPDMLHPSEQAVEYIWERLVETYFSDAAKAFLAEWRPLKQALEHKPFHPDSEDYRAFMDKTMLKVAELQKKYPTFAL